MCVCPFTKSTRAVTKCNLTLSQTRNLDFSKLKEFTDDDFKFDENGRKSTKQVENTVEKQEIVCYEQFFLFHNVFKTPLLQTDKNQGLFRKGLLPHQHFDRN